MAVHLSSTFSLISSYSLQSHHCIYSKRLFFLTITTLKIFMGYSHSSLSYCVKAIHFAFKVCSVRKSY